MKAYHWRELIAERERTARLKRGEPDPDAPPVNVTLPPRRAPPTAEVAPAPVSAAPTGPRIVMLAATTPGRHICMECTHYVLRSCTNPRARHPVSGEYVPAIAARKDRESCGPSGRYWDARPARPQRVREDDGTEPMEYVPPVPFRKLEPFRDEVVAVLWERPQTVSR